MKRPVPVWRLKGSRRELLTGWHLLLGPAMVIDGVAATFTFGLLDLGLSVWVGELALRRVAARIRRR